MYRDKNEGGDNKTSNPFLSRLQAAERATSNLHMLTEQRKNQQYFQLLTCQNQIIYLDQQKRYAIVQSRYLQDLQQKSVKTKQQIQKISQQIKTQSLNQISFNKVTELKDQQIQKLKQHVDKNLIKIRQLEEIIRNQEYMLDQKQKQIKKCTRIYNQRIIEVKKQAETIILASSFFQANHKYTQTQIQNSEILKNIVAQSVDKLTSAQIRKPTFQNINWKPSTTLDHKSQIQKQSALIKKHEEQILKLKQNFKKILEQVTEKVGLKLQQLQKQKLDIKKWYDQNKKLKQENNQLRLTIRHINEQEQKIKIWRNTLSNFVVTVENDYKNSKNSLNNLRRVVNTNQINNQQYQNEEQNKNTGNQNKFKYLNEQKIRIMQATIDRFQAEQRQRHKKMVEIKELLDSNDVSKISQQNIVGNLVNLSAKIKEVIKFLLEEI